MTLLGNVPRFGWLINEETRLTAMLLDLKRQVEGTDKREAEKKRARLDPLYFVPPNVD